MCTFQPWRVRRVPRRSWQGLNLPPVFSGVRFPRAWKYAPSPGCVFTGTPPRSMQIKSRKYWPVYGKNDFPTPVRWNHELTGGINESMNSELIGEIKSRLAAAHNIVIASHVRPDGDAIGSLL